MDRPDHVTEPGTRRWRRARGPLAATLAGLLGVVVLGAATFAARVPPPPPAASLILYPPTAAPSTMPQPCTIEGGWPCEWAPRFHAAAELVARSPGTLGLVLVDRHTGARFTAGATGERIWTGSTIKLALTVYALDAARTGRQPLTPDARGDLAAMLHTSDDAAASRTWQRYGATAMLATFRDTYGMAGLTMSGSHGDWGALTATPGDLAALMSYALDHTHPDDRAWIAAAMRDVGDVQHWGMWSAGPGSGVKNGWLENPYGGASHWCVSTVGFTGDGERYVVAAMFQMPEGRDSLDLGARTLSDLAAVLFARPTPAPVAPRPT
ncbi:hypothetical protein [Longispora fulva]|uniref:Beta-lactamase class A n=1 Tax=Longispora fulva TaxID=619741 RepID=A0A8J7GMN2_9ACTN|nr:hypothetical protein [Longispora fulva]MBG6141146.1 hypothetical protein [Longispora fulva]